MAFIPAQEKSWFIAIFRQYTRWLFRRRFSAVRIRFNYEPEPGASTLFYANHNSWWDGLIPFYLNEFHFQQRGRAIMEDVQMERFFFFKWIGAFSINRAKRREAIYSLRYAMQSLQRPNGSVYIYPEGEIVPFTRSLSPSFEQGVGWLCQKLPEVDVVPIAIRIHTMRADKPELLVEIGPKSDINRELSVAEITRNLESDLADRLNHLAGLDEDQVKTLPRVL